MTSTCSHSSRLREDFQSQLCCIWHWYWRCPKPRGASNRTFQWEVIRVKEELFHLWFGVLRHFIALKHWRHYLVQKEFILITDQEALKYINGQHKLNRRHAKWVAYLQEFTFSLRHQFGTLNKVANALSRQVALLTTMHTKVVDFDTLRELYTANPSFGKIFAEVSVSKRNDYVILNGYLFRGSQLCIPDSSLRE